MSDTTRQQAVADEMIALVKELYPICRSITGDGVRATLDVIGRIVPLTVSEVPSGTQVLDWTVPDEWNIRDAYIAERQRPTVGRLHRIEPPRGQLLRCRSPR